MGMEKISTNTPEKECAEAGRSFIKSTEAISHYYYDKAGQDGHWRVIAPKETGGEGRIYVVQSRFYMGYLPNENGGRSEVGSGIAIVRYNDVSSVANRHELFSVGPNPGPREDLDTVFLQTPDEVLLIKDDAFKYKEKKEVEVTRPYVKSQGKYWDYTTLYAVGLAEYSKEQIEKHFGSNAKRTWLDYGNGIGNPLSGTEMGDNLFRDANYVAFQDLQWPVVLYNPNSDGENDIYSWSICQRHLKIKDQIPENIVAKTPEIKRLQEKWLAPFSTGIREVPKNEL